MKKRIVSAVIAVVMTATLPLMAFAHSGRTDGSGGHKDNKNKSGLGGYHYHCGGYPAHLHTNGVCPYRSGGSSSTYSSTPKTVYASRINAVSIPKTINAGESTQLKGTVYPSNATDSTITWSSDTPEIASVSKDGKLQANGVGTAVIVATTSRGTSTKFNITVNEILATGIEIENKIEEITLEEIQKLNVIFIPENTTYKDIEWSSSDENIVKVSSDGTITAMDLGTATITATHKELQDSFEIEVLPIKAESIEIQDLADKDEIEDGYKVNENDTISLTAIIYPENTTDKIIKWSVDDENIATIDENGNLTILATGTVVVTAETENGKTDKMTLEIYSNVPTAIGGTAIGGIAVACVAYFIFKRKKKNAEG